MSGGTKANETASSAGINACSGHGVQRSPEPAELPLSCCVWSAFDVAGVLFVGCAARISQQGVNNRASVSTSDELTARTRC